MQLIILTQYEINVNIMPLIFFAENTSHALPETIIRRAFLMISPLCLSLQDPYLKPVKMHGVEKLVSVE